MTKLRRWDQVTVQVEHLKVIFSGNRIWMFLVFFLELTHGASTTVL